MPLPLGVNQVKQLAVFHAHFNRHKLKKNTTLEALGRLQRNKKSTKQEKDGAKWKIAHQDYTSLLLLHSCLTRNYSPVESNLTLQVSCFTCV